jgi:membrane protease YdiL (CAAX protease family)
LIYFVWVRESSFAQLSYGVTKLFTIVWPPVAVLLIERRRVTVRPIEWGRHWRALPLGFLSGLIMGGSILGGYIFTPLRDYAINFGDDIRQKLADLEIVGPRAYIAVCVFLVFLHSLIEEFYWRWYAFGSLTRVWPLGVSYVLASLGFAAHHYVILGGYFSWPGALGFGTGVGVGGAVWCWLYRRQGTIAGAWLSHALVDAAIFIVGYDLIFG